MENLLLSNKIMKLQKTNFKDLHLLELEKKSDQRGDFFRLFCNKFFFKFNIKFEIKQISFATNLNKHTLRGMHFQDYPMQERKLLCCLKGKIWDVVVDIRKDSKTFGRWQYFKLDSKKCLFIPKGFAHGYITLTNNVELIYCMDEYYEPNLSKGFIWNDKDVNILWPHEPKVISNSDKNLSNLNEL